MKFPVFVFIFAFYPVPRHIWQEYGFVFYGKNTPIRYLYPWIRSPWALPSPGWVVPALPASPALSCLHGPSPGVSHQGSAEGKDHPPPVAVDTLPDADQDVLPQGHMAWSAQCSPGLPDAFLPRCFPGGQLYWVISPQGQELSLPTVQLHETSADPSLQPAKSLWIAGHPSGLSVTHPKRPILPRKELRSSNHISQLTDCCTTECFVIIVLWGNTRYVFEDCTE